MHQGLRSKSSSSQCSQSKSSSSKYTCCPNQLQQVDSQNVQAPSKRPNFSRTHRHCHSPASRCDRLSSMPASACVCVRPRARALGGGRRCPAIHTVCEIIMARWGTAAHITLMIFVIMTQRECLLSQWQKSISIERAPS